MISVNIGMTARDERLMKNKNQKLDILACQINVPQTQSIAAKDQHIEETAAKLRRKLSSDNYDLVVLPELSSIDYSVETFENLVEIAETLKGRSFEVFSELAKEFGVFIVYGIARKTNNNFYISQVGINSIGKLIGHYDKLHIANFGGSSEKKYFTPGKHLLVFEIKGINIAPIICYDIRIPELTRTLALEHNVELVLHCGAYGRDESFSSWHDFVVTRALENQLYILSLNRAGKNFGHSYFCPPWVDETTTGLKFPEFDEAFIALSVDTQIIEQVRKQYSFLADKHEDYNLLGIGPKLNS